MIKEGGSVDLKNYSRCWKYSLYLAYMTGSEVYGQPPVL